MNYLAVVLCLINLVTFSLHAKPTYAIATNGTPKYPKEFTHFDYVNPDAPKKGTLVLAAQGAYNSFNPFLMKGDAAVGIAMLDESYLHGCLMARSEDEPDSRYGMIAESVEVAPDRSWVDFHLRPEARFSDGSAITAADVVFTFETLLSKGQPFFKVYYKDVASVKALSPLVVRFSIKNPKNKEIQNVLAQMPVLSQKFYQVHDFENDVLVPPVGAGPYKIVSFDPGREVVFERIPNWWGDNIPCMKGRFNPRKIKFIYFLDQDVAFEAFKAGKYDLRIENVVQRWQNGYDFPAVQRGEIQQKVLQIPLFTGAFLLAFNTRRPFLQDVRVRQALSLGFDFGRLNKRLFGGHYKRAYSYFQGSSLVGAPAPKAPEVELLKALDPLVAEHILTEDFRYTYPFAKMSAYDKLVLAQKLLHEAGFESVDGAFVHKETKKPLTFTILLPRSSHALVRIVQDYARNLERIGIKTTLRLVETNQLLLAQQNFDFDITYGISAQTLSPGNEQSDFWSCQARDKKGSRNLAGICSPLIDKAIARVIAAETYEDLQTSTRVLDRLLLWGFYNLPLWHAPVSFVAHKKKVHFPEKMSLMHHLNLHTLWIHNKREKS